MKIWLGLGLGDWAGVRAESWAESWAAWQVGVGWALGVDMTCEIMKSASDVWVKMNGIECISALVLDGLNVKTSSKILSKARASLSVKILVWVCASPGFEPCLWHTS